MLRFAVIAAVLTALLSPTLARARPAAADAGTTITLDGKDSGRVFDGVGAISASSSHLLYDYPERERSQILDYMFRPKYGASLDMLKVEIGADTNSTAVAEPSHERARGEVNCGRGYEWWLMREAVKRNPKIRLTGLMWGVPGWLNGGRWGADHVAYTLSWLDCAKRNGLDIYAVGGGNEQSAPRPPGSFFIALKKALATTHPDVKVLSSDEHAPPDYWKAATEMRADPAYADAVDIVGEHDVCVWRSHYDHCHVNDDALALGKPLWNSEQSTQDAVAGAGPLARAMNRNYLDAKLTGNVNWSAVAAFYDTTDTGGTGLIAAQWPWSGYYELGPSVWVDAQTTQFTEPGWHYMDHGGGYLPPGDGSGGSYVSLRSPSGDDYTVVAETIDATAPQTVKIAPTGGLPSKPLHMWTTDLKSKNWFVDHGTVRPGDTVTLPPGQVVTLSTTTGHHGNAQPRAKSPGQAALPYKPDFAAMPAGRSAPWFSDVGGAFEANKDGTLRQVITQKPWLWGGGDQEPVTLTGDPSWWGDYAVTADARSDAPVELLGRVDKYASNVISGDHLRVEPSGAWRLYSVAGDGTQTTLASGTVPAASSRHLGLSFRGEQVRALIDGKQVAEASDAAHRTGQVGLGVGSWSPAQFSGLEVRRTAPAPKLATPVYATASSFQPGVSDHHEYQPDQVGDGRLATWWQSAPDAALPQYLTADLGRARTTRGLEYRPPIHSHALQTVITGYRVEVSTDGSTFHQVASGTWDSGNGTKIARWPATRARYVRLVATSSQNGTATVAELGVIV